MTGYRDAGVDITKGDEAVERLKKHVEQTYTKEVLQGVGAYAGSLSAKRLKSMEDPVLLFTIDGVGTKTAVAEAMAALYRNEATGTGPNPWRGIGHDIVHHCANDLVCQGAEPLVFLDYVASSSLDPAVIEEIVAGMSEACRAIGCALIGGETAEMPQVYHPGAHDVVGTMAGIVERDRMITGENICAGDVLIALPSNGLHTNGYSLAREALLEQGKFELQTHMTAFGSTLGEALLKPHTEYSRLVRRLHSESGLKGVAHITGSGIPGNLPRIFPEGLGARIEKKAIRVLPIFTLIQEQGNVPERDMFDTFNMGAGMILVTEKAKKDAVLREATGSYAIGEVIKGSGVQFV